MLKEVTQPVLIIQVSPHGFRNQEFLPMILYRCQGERNEVSPLKYAERLVADLVNAEGGAILYEVKGASSRL